MLICYENVTSIYILDMNNLKCAWNLVGGNSVTMYPSTLV